MEVGVGAVVFHSPFLLLFRLSLPIKDFDCLLEEIRGLVCKQGWLFGPHKMQEMTERDLSFTACLRQMIAAAAFSSSNSQPPPECHSSLGPSKPTRTGISPSEKWHGSPPTSNLNANVKIPKPKSFPMQYSNPMACLLLKRNGSVPPLRRDCDNSAERWEGWSKPLLEKDGKGRGM